MPSGKPGACLLRVGDGLCLCREARPCLGPSAQPAPDSASGDAHVPSASSAFVHAADEGLGRAGCRLSLPFGHQRTVSGVLTNFLF